MRITANNEIHINYHLGYEKAIKFAIMTTTEGVIRPTKTGCNHNCRAVLPNSCEYMGRYVNNDCEYQLIVARYNK